jgi:hypothetical protein
MRKTVGLTLLALLTAAVAFLAAMTLPTEDAPTPWHRYLWRNDARIVLAVVITLPILLGFDAVRSGRRLLGVGSILVGAATVGLVVAAFPAEIGRFFSFATEPLTFASLGWCVLCWIVKRLLAERIPSGLGLFLFAGGLGGGVAALAGWEGWIRIDLPPNYHDEYAYLFQAWTYLDGKVAYPVDRFSPAFEQVHVLNRDVFASRYFPGTALWLLPWVALGKPIVGMWIAHGMATAFYALLARRLHPSAGLPAAMLIGTAPGMAVFSDAILSTMPTMLAIGIFLWAWFGAMENGGAKFAVLAGLAIGFAFITRPLTAVGIGLPFAVVSLWRLWKPQHARSRTQVLAMIAAFVAVAALLPVWSFATLGTIWETPYGRYTAQKTPSHLYGFYNVDRGAVLRGPETFLPYDVWATNHTPNLAIPMVATRTENLLREGVGGRLFAYFFLTVSFVLAFIGNGRTLLLWLSAIGLALIYAPYWFVGLFGYGYLAEALPILLVLIGHTAIVCREWLASSVGSGAASAVMALVFLRALANVGDIVPGNFAPNSDPQFARREKKRIVEMEKLALREGCNILVLVRADPKTAVHSTLVNNHPRLEAPVVRAWEIAELKEALMERYADRAVYLLEYQGFAEPFEWRRIRGPTAKR